MPKKLLFPLFALCLCAALPARAADLPGLFKLYDKAVYDAAVKQAREKNLANDPYWETLLHYKRGWVSGYRSLIDDENFFLSPEGKRDSQAELEATLEKILFYQAEPDQHAQCRFPARTRWLKEQLPALQGALPEADCPHYDNVTKRIAPSKATLAFPFFNMDGPGSIFGHTLIRLERDNSAPLLGYAVTYAADGDDSGQIAYIFKGLFGGFHGRYAVLPYSSKLTEYGSMESRDVWEYELNLGPDEVMRMYDHIWEVSLVLSDYFFVDENCAYNLLFFFEAARPGVKLTDGYIAVLPVDTIKAVEGAGFVSKINFRPSNVKTMQAMAASLDSGQVSLARSIAEGGAPAAEVAGLDIPSREKAAILDLSGELLRFYNTKIPTDEQHAAFRRLSIEILGERARVAWKNEYEVPRPAVSPEKGHDTSRLTLDAGYAFDSPYAQIAFRPFYHSLDDNAAGFLEGAGATVADLRLRYYTDSERFGLERFALVDMHNLLPFNTLYKPLSWLLSTGIDDRSTDSERSFRVAYLNGGGGLSFAPVKNLLLWGAGVAEGQYQFKEPYNWSAGLGAEAGLIINTGSFGKLLVEGKALRFSDSSRHKEFDATAQYSFFPAANHAISAKARYLRVYEKDGADFGLSYSFYF